MALSVLIAGANREGSLEGSYSRAFQRLGCDVHFWDPAAALNKVVRGYKAGRLFSAFVNVEPWLRKANLELLEVCERLRPNLLLVIGTEGVRAGTLGQLRAQLPEILIYCLFPDTPHNLVPDRIQCLPMFDRVITVSPGWVDTFRRLGAQVIHYLPLAADTDLHQPIQNGSGPSKGHDVAFIGNWRREREELLDQLLDFDLAIWGTEYWKRNTRRGSKLATRWQGRPLFGAEFAHACASNRILLNIIDGVWPGPNMRVFEQPACRAFSLVTRTPAIVDLFTEGENIECFDSAQEARDKIDYYLKNDTARERIADESYRFVVQGGHTYVDRAGQLLEWASQDARL